MIKNEELIQIKKTKFVEMYWDEKNKRVYMQTESFDTKNNTFWKYDIYLPINKIPQVIRGLFSAYTRFHKRGYVKKNIKNGNSKKTR